MATPNNQSGIVSFGLKYHKLVILIVTALVCFGIYALEKMNKNEFPSFTVREAWLWPYAPVLRRRK